MDRTPPALDRRQVLRGALLLGGTATLGEGLAVRGEHVAGSGPDIDAWLSRTGLARPR